MVAILTYLLSVQKKETTPGAASVVATVTRSIGTAYLRRSDRPPVRVALFARLLANDRIDLSAGASLVVTALPSGVRVRILGPGRAMALAGGVRPFRGARIAPLPALRAPAFLRVARMGGPGQPLGEDWNNAKTTPVDEPWASRTPAGGLFDVPTSLRWRPTDPNSRARVRVWFDGEVVWQTVTPAGARETGGDVMAAALAAARGKTAFWDIGDVERPLAAPLRSVFRIATEDEIRALEELRSVDGVLAKAFASALGLGNGKG